MPCVVQAGTVVGDTEFLDALDSACIFDRDGSVIGQGPQQHFVASVDPHIDIHHLDDTQDFASRANRHADHRTSLGEEIVIARVADAFIRRHVSNDQRRGMVDHPSGQAFTRRQLQGIEILATLPTAAA